MPRLNELERKLLGEILDEAIQELSNNSCNDLPIDITDGNVKQVRRLIRSIIDVDHDWQKDMLDDAKVGNKVYMTDWMVLQHLRDKILGE